MNILRKGFITLTVSGLLLGSAGFVAAQQDTLPQTSEVLAQGERGRGKRGGVRQRGQRFRRGGQEGRQKGARERGTVGLALGRFSIGTTVELSFYNGNPENGGTAQTSLTHVIGKDSEVVFAEAFQTARADATHITMSISEQTRTLDLSAMHESSEVRSSKGRNREGRSSSGGLGRLGAGLNRLNEGSTVSATFYDGDPEAGGNVLQSLSFAYGEDSARGFMNEMATAAEDAAFVTVITSPQERTVEVSSLGARGFKR